MEGGGGCNFYIKNNLKPKRFDEKKSLQTKTKNSHFEILIKNLVTFTKQDRAKDEKL